MTKIIALDDGHGKETAGKRTPAFADGSVMKENEFNSKVVEYLDIELQRCGFQTLLVAEGDADIPLKTRTDLANNTVKNKYNKSADYYISVHANASRGEWSEPQGIETIIQTGLSKSGDTYKYAEIIHKWLMKGSQLRDRGIKFYDLHVTRATNMPACLVECGFMDNKHDAALLISDEYRRECAFELAQAVCEIFNVKYVEETALKKRNILNSPSITIEQMQAWAKSKNAAQWFIDQAKNFYDISVSVGVDPALTYCQSAKETGYGKFGGVIDESYNNPCGMKVSAGGGDYDPNAHMKFTSWIEGILAQVDHLALYAGQKEYPKAETADPRHFPYLLGSVVFIEDLGGKWAPSLEYGKDILKMMKELESVVIKVTEEPKEIKTNEPSSWAKDDWEWAKENGITDGTNPKGDITREQSVAMLRRQEERFIAMISNYDTQRNATEQK